MAHFPNNLIDEIKKHPCLFIEDNAVFRDQDLKNKAWIEISRKLDSDAIFLQSVWKKLRECYRIVLYARSRAKNSRKSQKLWKFEEQMKFMEYYLQPKRRLPLTTGSLTKQRIVVTSESESMEISSSAITSKTNKPGGEMTSNSRQSSEITSQGRTTASTGWKETAGDKSLLPSYRLKNAIIFRNLPENNKTAQSETVQQEGRAIKPEVTPGTSVTVKIPLPETTENEVEILYDNYQEGNRIPGRQKKGFRKRSGVFSKIEVQLSEITDETIENEVMILYEGNPLDGRNLELKKEGSDDDFTRSGPSKIFRPSPPQIESEVIIESDDEEIS